MLAPLHSVIDREEHEKYLRTLATAIYGNMKDSLVTVCALLIGESK